MYDEDSEEYLEAQALAEEEFPHTQWSTDAVIQTYREVFIRGYLAALDR